jgi:hypothetical protein
MRVPEREVVAIRCSRASQSRSRRGGSRYGPGRFDRSDAIGLLSFIVVVLPVQSVHRDRFIGRGFCFAWLGARAAIAGRQSVVGRRCFRGAGTVGGRDPLDTTTVLVSDSLSRCRTDLIHPRSASGRPPKRAPRSSRRLAPSWPPVVSRSSRSPGSPAARALVLALCSARTWQAMRDEGRLDGAAAGRAVAHAIQLILDDAKSTKKEP